MTINQLNAVVNNTRKTNNQPIPIFNANLDVVPLYYTVKQAATIMGFDPGTLRNWISISEKYKDNSCPFETVKKGGKRLILISSFNDYLKLNNETDICICGKIEIESNKPKGRGRPRNSQKLKTLVY